MQPQATNNCHYISRMVTTPWEEGQRFLHYYDFDSDRFERKSSRKVFAADRINSDVVERWLRDFVETPLGQIRASMARGELDALEQDWSCHRAALLMVWLQGGRVRTLNDERARRNLEYLAGLPEPELNWLVMAVQREHDLRLIITEGDGTGGFLPLYVPSTGLFPYLLRDAGCLSGNSFGLTLAIDIHSALLVTPAEHRGALNAVSSRPLLTTMSVGTSRARRVVVVPQLLERLGERQVREEILQWRERNDELIRLVNEKRALVVHAASASGLATETDNAGRIRYG